MITSVKDSIALNKGYDKIHNTLMFYRKLGYFCVFAEIILTSLVITLEFYISYLN